MKLLITGSNGHIGSYLIKYFCKKYKNPIIYLVDNLSTQRYSSLFNLPKNKKIKFIEADVKKYNFEKIIKKINIVIHLAAITNAEASFEKSSLVENNNFQCTKNISKYCIKFNKKLIFISTTSVYGSQSKIVDENCSKKELLPQSPYAMTKLKEERFLQKMSKKKLKFIILRFGTIFGFSYGMRFHTAVNKFCWQAVMDLPITVWTYAYNQYRPYLDINDAARSIEFAIKKLNFNGSIFNVLTLNSTVQEIIKILDNNIKNIKIKKVNSKIMNQLSYEVSNKKIRNKGFKFTGDIKKSISKTIKTLSNSNTI